MKKLLLIIATVFFILTSNAQTFDYFGQTPPGDTAVIFAPGIISLPDRNDLSITFSPDGNEVYYSIAYEDGHDEGIYYKKRVNDIWTEPAKEKIFNGFKNPAFSPDGKKIYLLKYSNGNTFSDTWMSERTTGGWSTPQILSDPFNTGSWDVCYSETNDSDIYFNSNRPGGYGATDIWMVHPKSQQAINIGSVVNSASDENEICVAPDGTYIIFSSNRKGGHSFNGSDFYVSFKKENDEWTKPVNMELSNAGINLSKYIHINPSISPDGKFLFFNRHNWSGMLPDIYWVSTSIIDTLKKIAMPATLVNQAIDKKTMLYPNPTNGRITLSLGTSQNRESLVEIYNLQGTQVFSKTFQNTPSATIDLTGNSAGIYVIKVIAGGVSYEEKIVKE